MKFLLLLVPMFLFSWCLCRAAKMGDNALKRSMQHFDTSNYDPAALSFATNPSLN